MVKRGTRVARVHPRFIRTRVKRGLQMWIHNGRSRSHAEMARYAVAAARISRVIGDPADAAWWLSIAASARLMARAERVALRRTTEITVLGFARRPQRLAEVSA